MRNNVVPMALDTGPRSALATLAKVRAESTEVLESDFHAAFASPVSDMRPYRTALDRVAQGVCYFGADFRLIVSNRQYAEIYRLRPEDLVPGISLREVAILRYASGACPNLPLEEYVAQCHMTDATFLAERKTVKLKDGRTIAVFHQPLPDGGYVATHEDITDRKNEHLSIQSLIDWIPDFLWIKDQKGRFIIANQALAWDSGRASAAEMTGLSDFDLHPAERAEEFFEDEQQIFASGEPMIDREEMVISAAGVTNWILSTKVPVRNAAGEIFGLVGIARNITDRKREDELRIGRVRVLELIASGAPLKEVLDHLIRVTDDSVTGLFSSILLMDAQGVHLQHMSAPGLPDSYRKAVDKIRIGPATGSCGAAAFLAEQVIVADIRTDPLWDDYRHLAAPYGYRSCWSTPILSERGTVLGVYAMYSTKVRHPSAAELSLIEISVHLARIAIQRKLNEDRLEFMANYDSLTGLPNRTLMNDRLAQAISYANRYDRGVSVAFIDIDNFKTINDSLGHHTGDILLKTLSARMAASLKTTDTLVRLGGDEFVVILFDQAKAGDAVMSALQKIRAAISEPLQIGAHNLHVTASIGLASYPADGANADALLANADAAMYRAKNVGRDNFQFYTPELNQSVHEKFLLQEELRGALARSEFILHYQPQVDLATGKMFGVEALIRWIHPKLGFISPAKFIPIAEETGLIVQIGEWVLRTACLQNKAWQEAGHPGIQMCVNVSARQFKEANLVARTMAILEETGLSPDFLELELTESLIMQDVGQAVATMKALKNIGITLAIDDFGTGYSSLSVLKNFPVDRLKIDKTFVDEILSNESDKAVVGAVISLAHNLKMRVIAEGVETAEQMDYLAAHGCDEMQGYYFSKPVLPEGIGKLLAS